MALLRQIPKPLVKMYFTHKGLYAGIVPIYMRLEDGVDYDNKDLEAIERNWIPTGTIKVVQALWKVLTIFRPIPAPVYVTGDL